MKNWKFLLFTVAILLAFASCKKPVDQSVSGVIADATMNTLTVITSTGDTLYFSTMDADRSEANGLLLGDTAVVTYQGNLKGVTAMKPISALKVVVTPQQNASLNVVGIWIQPINGQPGKMQGMNLQDGGMASSVNMASLVYETWNQKNGQLILGGQSKGNGQTITFSDTMKIERVTPDSLILSSKGQMMHYARQK